jgi:hypothetical protein
MGKNNLLRKYAFCFEQNESIDPISPFFPAKKNKQKRRLFFVERLLAQNSAKSTRNRHKCGKAFSPIQISRDWFLGMPPDPPPQGRLRRIMGKKQSSATKKYAVCFEKKETIDLISPFFPEKTSKKRRFFFV